VCVQGGRRRKLHPVDPQWGRAVGSFQRDQTICGKTVVRSRRLRFGTGGGTQGKRFRHNVQGVSQV